MPKMVRFNLPDLAPQLGAAMQRVRGMIPSGGTNGQERKEKIEFSHFNTTNYSTEMQTFQNGINETGSVIPTDGEGRGGDKSPSQSFVEGVSEYNRADRDQISEWQAGWNVTNAIQGMFIVSLPYAVENGGYWAIVAMIGIAYICCHTGKILVDCLYEENELGEKVRVRDSYVAIAQVGFGEKYGGQIVNGAQVIELLMTCILYVVLCGDLLRDCFPGSGVDSRSWMMLSGMVLIPCGFLKNLHHVSTLSFWCTVAHLFVNVVILGYCLTCAGSWYWSEVEFKINILTFPISLGIIVFSYTSQIFLPTLEGNMTDRSKFEPMLNWSHIAAAVFKSLFGYMGFLTWGRDTDEIITNNLPTAGFKAFVNFILVIKALLSYPLPFFAAMELFEKSLFVGVPQTQFPSCWALDGELKVWGLAVRTAMVVVTIIMAITIPHFAILMGFIGSFTGTMLSFVWPCYFHIKIKGQVMTLYEKAYDYFIIFLGFLFGLIGIYYSGRAMIKAYQIGTD